MYKYILKYIADKFYLYTYQCIPDIFENQVYIIYISKIYFAIFIRTIDFFKTFFWYL